jgi:hypothetical protein
MIIANQNFEFLKSTRVNNESIVVAGQFSKPHQFGRASLVRHE